MPDHAHMDSAFEKWLQRLSKLDPTLYKELAAEIERMRERTGVTSEAVRLGTKPFTLEAIVHKGRPALLVQNEKIVFDGIHDSAARTITRQLESAAKTLERRCLPFVGRIDVANYPGLSYVGTGWLVEKNMVVTNRHVALLLARADAGRFRFLVGGAGTELAVSIDSRHEYQINASTSVAIKRVLWIEMNERQPDIAFLEVDGHEDNNKPSAISIAEFDAREGTEVAAIGYPARGTPDVVPNQAWMDRIYSGVYEVKRVAPGLVTGIGDRGISHDCTTLGGNSGSAVVSLKDGCAVGLHYQGLYLVNNDAVPASVIRQYLKNRPWQGDGRARQGPIIDAPPPPAGESEEITVKVPITVRVRVGKAKIVQAEGDVDLVNHPLEPQDIEAASADLLGKRMDEGIKTVWPGYLIENGVLSDKPCLVVAADPNRLAEVTAAVPRAYAGFPVDVRPATLSEMLSDRPVAEAVVSSVRYNDKDRKGKGFSFNWVNEKMDLLLHVGPEQSWKVLSEFLAEARHEFVSSMYQFHAAHIASAVDGRLRAGVSLQLVVATQTRDPRSGKISQGDFDRNTTFEKWARKYKKGFQRIFVPLGSNGLVANSYHIKVTVRDRSAVWLSSGNWTHHSQPLPKDVQKNREWHVVIQHDELAKRFRNHIKADYDQSAKLGGTPEAVEPQYFVDVPQALLEAAPEAAPGKPFDPKPIRRKVRVKPLLTPDHQGGVYSEAVLDLIRSARHQLLFQNQYIKMKGADNGYMKELVDALVKKARTLDDFRIILRSHDQNPDLFYDVSQLKRHGVDVNKMVRPLRWCHNKGIVVDGQKVLLGSHNWSSSGVTLNRDASLIFDDKEIAAYFADVFEVDWKRAPELKWPKPGVKEAVRLSTGEDPAPRGYLRMSLTDYLDE